MSMAYTTEQRPDEYDVAIMGGGLAGLTLALQLKQNRPDTSVLVIERQKHPVPEAAHKVGESTVEIGGRYLRNVLGLEDHLERHQLKKFGIRMFFSDDTNEGIASRPEIGHSAFPPHKVISYQLDRGRLENALGQEAHTSGVTFVSGWKVQELELRPDQDRHRLSLVGDDGAERRITARWVVDATGRSSTIKRQLGLAKQVGHRANAAWFRIGHPIDIDQWSDDPGWHDRIDDEVPYSDRELSTNHLMGPGYWVWLIRLASDAISIGIVADADMHPFATINRFERAMDWLRENEPECARVVERYRDKLQDFRVLKNYSYGCEQVMSGDRWCLTGEAGVFLDPLYSPGLDMIAIGNGLITDLVTRALDGEDVGERAAIHNRTYLTVFEDWLNIFEGQYPLMGNARAMMSKIIWDTTRYWAGPGWLYFHDVFRRLAEFPQMQADLARFHRATEQAQRFLREWHAIDQSGRTDPFVRYYDLDFMKHLHIAMCESLSDEELSPRFAANVRFMERMTGHLVSTVMAECREQPENEVVRQQLKLWESDASLMGLAEIYHEDSQENPVNDLWITLRKSPERVRQTTG
ncbi:NAD(P)/FAD-dependent oxidoreductase [Streptomyces geranii]|uniref:NAD(P)/FAD-dependent oxidoreductase n=1 Tax=Streptomyces geranii TaxID=2058923 RepID=UPI0018E5A661|nr:FAD-dependent monooxygenase [Streptomyces geranii]